MSQAPTPPRTGAHAATASGVRPANFLRSLIEHDLARGTYSGRRFGGSPGSGTHHEAGAPDPARIRTRFPPEPNGYLHIGHAKSVCLNFGLAADFGGVCHLRFDDTNPEREEQEYVDAIIEMVHWLGWSWQAHGTSHLYFASDYFGFMAEAAEYLIQTGHAYVDEQTPEKMKALRGDFTTPGTDSPFRGRTPEENLARFREMRAGHHVDGAMVLRAKIDMASPNINLRDPAIYRIKHATHHNTGDAWCVYPMYSFAHPIEDALEHITHSLCTLEFEDQRPFYDWTLERIVPMLRAPQFARARAQVELIATQGVEAGKEFALHCRNHAGKLFASAPEAQMRALFHRWAHQPDAVLHDQAEFFALLLGETHQFSPLLTHALDERLPNPFQLPHQHEFGRLNLNHVVTSKRKLRALVEDGVVEGWDDPRMPTLAGLRRRGFTPASIRRMAADTGASKTNIWVDDEVLNIALRDDLEVQAPRAMAVLDPLKLHLTNWAEVFGSASHIEPCRAPAHPQRPELGERRFTLGPEVWIERDDFAEVPPKGFFRLFPGNRVRLKYGVVVECTGCVKDVDGHVLSVLAAVVPDTRSGTPGADAVKVKGTITWVALHDALPATLNLFEHLFTAAQPEAGGRDPRQSLNPHSKRVVQGWLEPSLARLQAEERLQFERHGYFIADRKTHRADAPVLNRITGLRDTRARPVHG